MVDACASAGTLSPGSSTTLTLPFGAGALQPRACQPERSRAGFGREAILRVSVTAPGTFRFAAGPASTDDPVDPIVYLRRACADEATELGCNDTGPQAALVATGFGSSAQRAAALDLALPPGEYDLVVDGMRAGGGAVRVAMSQLN